ncbi:MAG: cellulase family glycosylhydrolase [bacterium]|nr:cellulase family glycosylhydrolase [bacterium]
MRRVGILLLAMVVATMIMSYGQEDEIGPVRPAVGLVKFDLWLQYLGTASGEKVPRAVTLAMGKKSIVDAKNLGIKYFRIAASGYSHRDLLIWQANPEKYWEKFDEMIVDLHRNNIKIIPTVVWWIRQFPLLAKENTHTFLTDRNSKSRSLLNQYMTELVLRYRDSDDILFWEMGNEWDLDAELDIDRRFKLKGENFTSDELINFTLEFTKELRSLDPSRMISSGFYGSRRTAVHLQRQPEWSENGPDWTEDSMGEFIKNLLEMHKAFDIISYHPYNFCENADCTSRDNERFSIRGSDNADILDIVKAIADAAGKLLFLGEFGDNDPSIPQDGEGRFTQSVLRKIVSLRIPFSALWGWQYYPNFPYYVAYEQLYTLEPGMTDFILTKLKDTNQILGWPTVVENPDVTPPQIVLTYPFNRARLLADQIIYAGASDNDKVERVEFWLDREKLDVLYAAPYQTILKREKFLTRSGGGLLVAVAYDRTGNSTKSWIRISFAQLF